MKRWAERKVFILFALLFAYLLIGCSLFERRNEVPRKEIKDQNYRSSVRQDPGLRKRVVILPFLDANPNRDPALKENIRNSFIRELNRTGGLIAVDTEDLKVDFTKHIQNGEYDLKKLSALAQNMGVNALLEAKIIDIKITRSADKIGIIRNMTTQFECVARVRMSSLPSGKEIFNTVKTVTVEDPQTRVGERTDADKFVQNNPDLIHAMVRDAFMDFTPQIMAALNKLQWEGRIAAISGDRIYLNVGRISGLQVGDVLKVSEDGEDVFDPESGGHIGKVPGRTKGTLEVVSYFGNDGAIAIIHSGSGFKENDKVEMY